MSARAGSLGSLSLWPWLSSGLTRLPVSRGAEGQSLNSSPPRASSCRHSQGTLGGPATLSWHLGKPRLGTLGLLLAHHGGTHPAPHLAPHPAALGPAHPSPAHYERRPPWPRPFLGPNPRPPFLPSPVPAPVPPRQALTMAGPRSLLLPPPRALFPPSQVLPFILYC